MLNRLILNEFKNTNSKLLLVTKYLNSSQTKEIFAEIFKSQELLSPQKQENRDTIKIIALGENRIDDILQKKIPRNFCHFIGNIQSRRIPEISENCAVIHSLCNLKHAELFAKQKQKNDFFIQINISGEPQKSGISPLNFAEFYKSLPDNLNIIGISGMGKGTNFTKQEKIKEFKTLLNLREKFNPQWQISAGTSADYKIALSMGIDIIRLGRVMFK